jgi:hypothetical protein
MGQTLSAENKEKLNRNHPNISRRLHWKATSSSGKVSNLKTMPYHLETPYSFPIEKWIEFEEYITRQLPKLGATGNANIEGLSCSIDPSGKISYPASEFGQFHKIMKLLYKDVVNHPDTADNNGSMLRVFSSDRAVFAPFYFVHHRASMPKSLIDREETSLADTKQHMENLFRGSLDAALLEEKPASVSNFNKELFEYVFKESKMKPVCMTLLTVIQTEGVQHAISAVLYKNDLYLFDPMYYIRAKDEYIWALELSYWAWRTAGIVNEVPLQIHNLSEYCLTENSGEIKCVQYKVDAEYCLMYSTYFIYILAKHGFPLENAARMRQVINETYITDPKELRRNPCLATNQFRIQMISFIITALICNSGLGTMLNCVEQNACLQDVFHKVYTKTGIHLLHPEIISIINSYINLFKDFDLMPKESPLFPLEGGGRRRRRRTRRRRNPLKK